MVLLEAAETFGNKLGKQQRKLVVLTNESDPHTRTKDERMHIEAKELKVAEIRRQILLCFKFVADLVYANLLPFQIAEDIIESILNDNLFPRTGESPDSSTP